MRQLRNVISAVTLLVLILTGCSHAPVTKQPTSNQSGADHPVNSSQPTNGQGSADLGPGNGSPTNETTNSTQAGTSSTTHSQFSTDVQSVIAAIHATPVQLNKAVAATINGQPDGFGLQDVHFISATTGFLAGKGIILKTTDGGKVFHTALQTTVNLKGITVAKTAAKTIIAWGDDSVLISNNGGLDWKTEKLAQTGNAMTIQQVEFPTQSEGFAVIGDGYSAGTLWQTIDGGIHWQKCLTPSSSLSISFGSAMVGWLGTLDGNIYETIDGGHSWTRAFHPTVPQSSVYPGRPEVHAVSATTCWAKIIGNSGMSQTSYAVFRTANGSDWHPVLSLNTAGAGPAPDGADKAPQGPGMAPGPFVAFDADNAVLAGVCRACNMGSATMSATKDGGSSWKTQPTIPNGMGEPINMSFVSVNDGWILDTMYTGGTVLLHTTDGGASWTEVYPEIYPHPVEGISFLNANVGYGLGVPGNANAVLKSTDGGHRWRLVGTLPTKSMKNPDMTEMTGISPIDFVDDNRGYAIGSDGIVYETSTGGHTWTSTNIPKLPDPFVSISFIGNGQFGLANTDSQSAEVTVDGGFTWHTVDFPDNSNPITEAALYLAGLTQLPIANTLRTLVHSEKPDRLGMQNEHIAWMPEQNGQGFLATTNGGTNWMTIGFSAQQNLYPSTIDFVNGQDGWMISMSGALLCTTDGGKTWAYATHE